MSTDQARHSKRRILLLGTGGTIAGLQQGNGSQALSHKAYQPALVPIEALVPTSPHEVVCEQLAQIDSKDMSFALWAQLHRRIQLAQHDAAIDAIVIAHGTDTLEETAYFLHRTASGAKPVVLTGAMRAADAPDSDGAANLTAALAYAGRAVAGVWVAFAGEIFQGDAVQKSHPTRLDAFTALEPLEPSISAKAQSQNSAAAAWAVPDFEFPLGTSAWPRVEIILSYAGVDSAQLTALLAQGVDGIVLAGTGDATVHHALQALLDKAYRQGVRVRVVSRCQIGYALQARIDLLLELLHAPRA